MLYYIIKLLWELKSQDFLGVLVTSLAAAYKLALLVLCSMLIFDYNIFKNKLETINYIIRLTYLVLKYMFILCVLSLFDEKHRIFQTFAIFVIEIYFKLIYLAFLKYLKGSHIQGKLKVSKFFSKHEEDEIALI